MSSERRHQLEHNELAVWLGKVNKSIEPHSKPIAAVVAVAVVAGIAWTFLTTEQLAKRSDATLQLIQAAAGGDSEVLAKVGDTYSDTEAGSWARLYQGQQLMIQGMTALYRNREEAEILLSDAKQALQSAVNSSSNNLLASRGHYAIAQIEEALGDVSDEQGEDGESMLAAIDSYQKVIDLNESEAMVERAEERIAALKKPATREFIAWFSEQDFSPTNDPSLPPSTLPGGSEIPGLPDLDLSLPALDLGGEGTSETPEGGLELPDTEGESADPATTEEATTEEATTEEATTDEGAGESASAEETAEEATPESSEGDTAEAEPAAAESSE